MARANGWIEAYTLLEEDKPLPEKLREKILSNKNGMNETMLHWYAIEGEARIIQEIIDRGFEVNTQNRSGQAPLYECALLEKWEVVEILLKNGADPEIKGK